MAMISIGCGKGPGAERSGTACERVRRQLFPGAERLGTAYERVRRQLLKHIVI